MIVVGTFRSNDTLAMSWVHYQFQIQNKTATALIDKQFAEIQPAFKIPNLAWFGVYFQKPNSSGWWKRSEESKLDDIERDLIKLCSSFSNGWAVYVRRLETLGLREYYFYFGGNAELCKVLPSLQALHKDYRLEFESRQDAEWSHYKSWLKESAAHG